MADTAAAAAVPSPRPIDALRQEIDDYYTEKIRTYGPTPMGVDWSCQPTQELRFVQLLRLCDFSTPFTLNDVGCGYGALVGFISRRYEGAQVDYLGIDLSEAMILQAKKRWQSRRDAHFIAASEIHRNADYCVASGIFNVRIHQPLPLWEEFIATTLRQLSAASRNGFAVNFLKTQAPEYEGKQELYRTTPERWVSFCEGELAAKKTTVLDAYGMREFTLLIRN